MKTLKHLFLFLLLSLILIQCKDDDLIIPNPVNPPDEETPAGTKSQIDDYFDWDMVQAISMYNPSLGRVTYASLPWETGNTGAMGIPKHWLDPSATDTTNYTRRKYHRSKHWVLVYSNLMSYNSSKFFTLYNKLTGQLRFFFYAISTAPGAGTSGSYWGLNIDSSSSLFNFTQTFANGSDSKSSNAVFLTSTPCIIKGFLEGAGYIEGRWYGLEVECAYDPTTLPGTNFNVKGWAVQETEITGNARTDGSLKGTITASSPNATLNLSMFNTTSTTTKETAISVDNGSSQDVMGDELEKKVNSGDQFAKGLWNNLKSQLPELIGKGVKEGVKALFTSGASLATSALGKLAGSVLGGNGGVQTVDLKLVANTSFNLKSTADLPGWGEGANIPVPGSTSYDYNQPLHNVPLGVWNLRTTPTIDVDGLCHDLQVDMNTQSVFTKRFFLNCTENDLIINPAIKDQVTVQNFRADLACTDYTPFIFDKHNTTAQPGLYKPEPFASIDGLNYYSKRIISSGKPAIFGEIINDPGACLLWVMANQRPNGNFKALISFELADKNTGKVYSFSRWFNTSFGTQRLNYKKISCSKESVQLYINELKNGAYYSLNLEPNKSRYIVSIDRDYINYP